VLMTRSPSPSSSAGNANALGVAKLWANRLHPGEKPGDGQLVGYLVLIGYTVPPDGGPGHVGETIRALRPRL
jgi:hypothetical protein